MKRSNRYMSAPAGTAEAIHRKAKPGKSKKEINEILLVVFFIFLPVLGLISIFLQPVRWLFIAAIAVSLIAMWVMGGFLPAGRIVVTSIFGLLFVFTLISLLNARNYGDTSAYGQVTIPTPTPNYTQNNVVTGTMGLSETAEPDPTAEPVSYAETDGTDDSTDTASASGSAGYTSAQKSDAEIVLENFMEKWRKGIIADMVQYTSSEWRSRQESPEQQLFWKFKQKPLVDWRQISAPSGTDANTSRTITIQADVTYSGETRTYQYEAVILNENGEWKVDPDSLSSGMLVEEATPTPDPNATPTPTPEPTPTPTIDPKLTLYYNKDGGSYYHIDQNCSKVAKKYLPLTGKFTYQELGKTQYNKLVPCDKCNPPARMTK